MIVDKKIASICDVITGGTPPKSNPNYFNGSILWAKPDCLDHEVYVTTTQEHLSKEGTELVRVVPKDSIMVSCIGIIGKVAITSTKMATNQQINSLVIKDKENTDTEYLFYLIKSLQQTLQRKASKSLVPILNKSKLSNITLHYEDDIIKQRTIVRDLSKKLLAINVIAETIEKQMIQVNGLIAGINKQTIEYNGKKEPISAHCSENKRIIQPESDDAKILKYLGMENIDKETLAYIASTDIIESGHSTTYYFDETHVLYGKLRPYLKKVFLPERTGRCSTELIPLLPVDTMEREYLSLLLTDDDLVGYIMKESTGARMPRTDMKKLFAYKVAVPNVSEQQVRLKIRKKQMEKCSILIEKLRKQQEYVTALRICLYTEAFGSEE